MIRLVRFACISATACALVLAQQKDDPLNAPRASVPLLPPALTWGQPFDPLTPGGKLKYQLYQTFGPSAIGRAAFVAAIDQWSDTPEEWGQGWDAYGRRFSSAVGITLTRRSIQFAVGSLRGEDPRFFRSGERGVWRRVHNQLVQTVRVRTDRGGTTFAAGRVLGVIGGTQLARFWLPQSQEGFPENLGRAGLVLATDVGTRIAREFWPDFRRMLRRKKTNGGSGNQPNPP